MDAILARLDVTCTATTQGLGVMNTSIPDQSIFQYWHEADWKAATDSKTGRTNTGGDRIMPYDFLESQNGKRIDPQVLTQIRSYAKSVYIYMFNSKEFPTVVRRWHRDQTVAHVEFIKEKMYSAWPEFTYCSHHWKLIHFITIHYPSWSRHVFPDYPEDLVKPKPEIIHTDLQGVPPAVSDIPGVPVTRIEALNPVQVTTAKAHKRIKVSNPL